MGIMNLLKSNWSGRVGETVGANWKGKSTIRTYAKPTYTNTPEQQIVRSIFGQMTKFVALFSDALKGLQTVNTKGMSIRNSIIKMNKEQWTGTVFDKTTLRISRGGLPIVSLTAPAVATGLADFSATWTPPTATVFGTKSRMVVVLVDDVNQQGYVGSALLTSGTITIPGPYNASAQIDVYYYVLDASSNARKGNVSTYVSITAPSA